MKELSHLLNKNIIITAGGTIEYIDPVRFIANKSSGKMGIALAKYAQSQNFTTTLICGNVDDTLLDGYSGKVVKVETTEDMLSSIIDYISDDCVLIMAAAPADFKPLNYSQSKIKKTDEIFNLELIRTPDILKNISEIKKINKWENCYLVGFAAETNHVNEYAKKKLFEKELDMICANMVGQEDRGFMSDNNDITMFFYDNTSCELGYNTKANLAVIILEKIDLYIKGLLKK